MRRTCLHCKGDFPASMDSWIKYDGRWFCCHVCMRAWKALVHHVGKPCTQHSGVSS